MAGIRPPSPSWRSLSLSPCSVPRNAADDYPTKTVKLFLPAAAGGPTDVPARLASQILQPKLGQPVVVEPPRRRRRARRPVVAAAAPDGYTLLVGNTSVLAVIPAVSASAGYDPVRISCRSCA